MIGCIVRITEDNINYDFLSEHGISLVGLCVKHDPDDEKKEYLIEFPEEHEFLHNGGDGPDCTRYWVDSELEILEDGPLDGGEVRNSAVLFDNLAAPREHLNRDRWRQLAERYRRLNGRQPVYQLDDVAPPEEP